MSFSCYRCRRSEANKMYFATSIDPQRLTRSGLLCPTCHGELKEAGHLIGYLPMNGTTIGWARSALTLRSFHDAYAGRDFRFREIRRIAGSIASEPRRDIRSQLQAVADVYGWIATLHGGPNTFEGWLFHVATTHLQTLLDDKNVSSTDPAERRRFQNILTFHAAVVRAASKQRRHALIQALVGLAAATLSSVFRHGIPESHRNVDAAIHYVQSFIEQPARPVTVYRTLECIQTGNPWLLFFTSFVGELAPSSVTRIAEMLLEAVKRPDDSLRREAVVRAIHWETRLLQNLSEFVPKGAESLRSRDGSSETA